MADRPGRTIRQFVDLEDLSAAAADELCRMSEEAVVRHGRCTAVLSGGSTPRRLFEVLAGAYRRRVNWTEVEFFWGDERAVPPDHRDSNFGMAWELLLEPLAIPQDHVHRIEAERGDLDAAARDYEADISRVLATPRDGPPPAFDLVLLGMGADGHTASLFPHSAALVEARRWVVPQDVSSFGPRVTMTPRIFNSARHVIFLVTGPDKAAALAQVLEGPHDPGRLPSQAIKPASGTLTWFVDRAAAARLTRTHA